MNRFKFDDQIASEPEAVRDVLRRLEVPRLDPERPLLFTGIGTSLHACRIAAAWVASLSEGRVRPVALEAHELGLRGAIRSEDQIVVVSHRGTKTYPKKVLVRGKDAGADTVLVTGFGADQPLGDWVLRTCPDETASTHSVSYVTALAALGLLVVSLLGKDARPFALELKRVPDVMKETLASSISDDVSRKVASCAHMLFTGFGLDEVTAEEAALKVKEGAYMWAEGMSVEFALHGTPAMFDPKMAAVVISPSNDDGGRTQVLQAMLRDIGARVFSCGSEKESDLRFAEVGPLVRPLVSIIPLQRLVAEMARERGTNPDTTRGDTEPWASAIKHVKL